MKIIVPKLLKPAAAGAGSPKFNNDKLVWLIPADEFVENGFPATDDKGVRLLGNMSLKPGAFAIPMYATASSKDYSAEAQGEDDAENFKLSFKANHPGDEIEATEFAVNYLGEGFVVVFDKCKANGTRKVLGSDCHPLKLKPGFKGNKDKTGFEFSFEQTTGSRSMHFEYAGSLITEESLTPEQASTAIQFLEENVNVVKIQEGTASSVAEISTVEKQAGDILTLVGQDSDATKAATLSSDSLATASGVVVLLKDGVAWKSLEGSTISFRVFKDSSNIFLIETTRT
jgi:hypothetical protein